MPNKSFTFTDIFSGIGGFRSALDNNGGKCLAFSEVDKDAINTYSTNYDLSNEISLGDITNVDDLPKHDLMTAGVPCQSWSIAGKNLGFDDDRGQLWNDTIYLLNKSQPKAFIFENVKGLVDPRNKEALELILKRIRESGYHASYHVINSYNYGVLQNRIRIYIIGFKKKKFHDKFLIPKPVQNHNTIAHLIGLDIEHPRTNEEQTDFLDFPQPYNGSSLSKSNGMNDYFLFNDIRNGDTTIHSWDILKTSKRQKYICLLLLKNRRKKIYGKFDGNPLSINHLQEIDSTITQDEINDLVDAGILKLEPFNFKLKNKNDISLSKDAINLFEIIDNDEFTVDDILLKRKLLKNNRITKTLDLLLQNETIECTEYRYDFKNGKISTGLFGINRIILPQSTVFPTLVAHDTNDFVSEVSISSTCPIEYKKKFISEIFNKKRFRKITKIEACKLQGFPENLILPESRSRWMKLIGNSVSVPVVENLCKAIINTGVFE